MLDLIELEEKRYEEIMSYVKEMKSEGKKLASWGAGRKGTAFAARIDPLGKLLSCIFDKYEAKWGSVLSSGHRVADFHKEVTRMDVVFLPMASFVPDNTALLLKSGFLGDIVNVEDWLLGGIREPLQKRLKRPRMKRVREARIAALVILYKPESLVAEHIASYADEVDELYVWDNSPEENVQLLARCAYIGKIRYIHHGANSGLGEPVNRIADLARESGMDWLLTFDQDSVADEGMVEAMREYVESDMLDAGAAVVAPMVDEPTAKTWKRCEEYLPYLSYVRSTITSGAMYRLDVLCRLRYRQEFFIDQLDHDFCIRAYLYGNKVLRLNHLRMHHQMDAGSFEMKEVEGYRFYVGKYSPDRYYYQYRNLLYSIGEFANIAPGYAASCHMGLKKLEIMVEHDINKESNKRAIRYARNDFEAGVLGKRCDF